MVTSFEKDLIYFSIIFTIVGSKKSLSSNIYVAFSFLSLLRLQKVVIYKIMKDIGQFFAMFSD